ncbi:PAS domain S-box protein [Methanosarcina hadiensis]|uniref:PAS domain S-box protein n=1 Tax=Methanosarcina hadiensis TaxID=3078083 RepID=UPI00397796C7
MKNNSRNSGIDTIGNVSWGAHICQFYRTKEDLMDILIPYLKAGLENNELCVWITPQFLEVEEAKKALIKAVPDLETHLEKGQIEIVPCDDWYLKEGIFNPQRALNNLVEKVNKSLASGYDGLRFVENICQLGKESRKDLVNYERKLDSVTGRYPVIALCIYSLDTCSATDIIEIATSHQFILSRKNGEWEITENSGRKCIDECEDVRKSLQESEARYRSLYENSLDGIMLTMPDGTVLSANPQACSLFGMTENEIIKVGREGLVVKDEKLEAALEERDLTGRMNAELTCRRKDGSTFVCNVASNIFTDADGTIKTSMIVRDITENKRAQETIRKSEERYRTLFTNMTEGFVLAEVIFDEDGKPYDYRYLEINPVYERSTGLKKEHVLGKSILEVVPDVNPIMIKKLGEVALSGRPAQFEIFSQITGKYFDTRVFSPERGKVAATFRDITARKQAEDALRERESRLKVIVANSPDIIFEQDRDLRYIWIYNPGHPLSVPDVIGKTDSDLVPPDQAQQLEEIKRRVLETGMREQDLLQLSPGGETRCFEAIYEPRYDANGQIISILSYTRDVTERKQMEKELQESERQQRELAQSIEVERARLAAILENLPVGVWIADRSGHLTGKNREADRIWAGDAPLLESIDDYAEYTAWHADNGKLLAPEEYPVARALLTGQPVEPVELRIRRLNGIEGVVLVSAVPIKDSQGHLIGAVGINLDITRLKQTEKELQESEENYRNIVETASEGIWIGDTEARTVYVNKRLTEMLGYTQEEMTGKFAWDFADEDEKPVVKKNIGRRREGIDERYEFKFIRKDGSPLWVIVSSKALFDKAGKFTGSMSLLTDITARKEAEAKLKETLDNLEEKVKERTMQLEKAYKSLEENEKNLAEAQRMARLGNWNWDGLTNRIYLSDEAYRIFGLKPQELEMNFSKFLSYVHPDDQVYLNKVIKKALGGESYSIDFRIILTGGEERVVHAQGEAIPDAKSTPFPIRGTIQDITERKRVEDKLRSSEEKYRSFIENFKGIAFQADESFVPVFMHGTVEEITGYSEEEFMSKQRWKDIIHPEDLPHIYKEEEKVRDSPYRASGEIDFRIIHRDGKIKWVHEIYQKIPGNDRTPDRYQGAIYDITGRKEAEEALAKTEKIRIKEIHHRIKNNLQVISSLLDLQAETFSKLEVCKTPEVVEAFVESQNRVVSMALIHEELYKGDKIDTLDFSAYLRKLTEELFSSYNPGNKYISFKLDLEQVDLSMDTAIPLGIVVNELVSNSFKHAIPAGGKGEIRISLQKADESAARSGILASEKECMQRNGFQYILTVSDNGKGVPEGVNIESSNSLGLQLVNILVEQIDGCIELERDQGAKFTILFSDLET